jgi:phosphate transport system substrate-binding protein
MLRNFFYVLLASGCTLARAAAPAPAAADAPAATTAKPAVDDISLIHIGGSDLLQTAVGEPLTRYAKQFHLDVQVDMLGSTPAMEGLKSGKIQLAIVAVPVGQNPAPPGCKAIPLCFTADYIIVNPANPITALSLRQVAGIFGAVQESIGSWSQLKLAGEWADRPIVPYSTSLDDGVVIEMLKFLALDQKNLRGSVHVLNTPDEVFSAVKNSPLAIGLCGYDPGPPFKVLLLSSDKTVTSSTSQTAVAPTPENIFSGEYPLRLPFYLVYNPANKTALLPFLRLVLSDAYAARLREAHFIPLTDTERNRALLGLDKPD